MGWLRGAAWAFFLVWLSGEIVGTYRAITINWIDG